MKQRELLAWYFREQNSKGAFSTLEELGKDARLVKLIMQVRHAPSACRFFGIHLLQGKKADPSSRFVSFKAPEV